MSVATIPCLSPEYPSGLRDLESPPAMLWAIGDLTALADPVVAIVGTRRATSYGLRITRELASAFARAGACVVSGMAFGIDAAAHRAVLDAGGRTVAVLGTGVDVAYPRANRALYHDICARGLVLSEFPPGTQARKHYFPQRNRIIAALARLTIVVEAPLHSGALNTCNVANELSRDVAAVPGPIDSPQSEGSNHYLREGVHVITSIDDALTLAGLPPATRGHIDIGNELERRVWEALKDGAATVDELCARSALPVAECLTTVTALELRGIVECALTGAIRRR